MLESKENRTSHSSVDEKSADLENGKLSETNFQTPSVVSNITENQYKKPRGVIRIENVKASMYDAKHGNTMKWVFGISILVCSWAYSLDSSTTYNYQPQATSSFNRHSMLSTLSTATSIISAVMKPILGKFSDLTSRPVTYIIVLVLYVLGYIIVASSLTISAYVIGEVFVSIGSAGLDFLIDVIVGDLTPLKWRGFMSAMTSTPFIINTWFSGLIVEAIIASNWRWGYGMFAIIMPVVISPAIAIMIYYDHKAQKLGVINAASSKYEKRNNTVVTKREWFNLFKSAMIEIDAFGLIVLGFGWSLLLLPFSLYKNAEGGWKNPSMVAMMVVGGLLLVFYTVFEMKWAPYPSMPKRILVNKTFICAVIIDTIYTLAGGLRSTYFSSYVWIIKDWSNQNWTYFNNTLTIALCVFGVVAGIYQRVTHRYKYLQIFGLAVKIIGLALLVRYKGADVNTATLVFLQILIGMGGAFSVVGSKVASQASVPHQDLTLVIALLQLWSRIGTGIGSAVAGPIWTSKMPANLRKYMPASVSDEQVTAYFSNLTKLRALAYDSEIRQAAIKAYADTTYYLFVPALAISFIPLIAAFFQTNYFLGDTQNAIEGHENSDPTKSDSYYESHESDESPKTWRDKLAAFYSKPLSASK